MDDSNPEQDGELNLPDELAAMAEQLGDDAQRLAACYPPRFGPVKEVMATVASVSPRRRSAGPIWLAGSVAGGLVALALLAVAALNWGPDGRSKAASASKDIDRSNDNTEKLLADRGTVDSDESPEEIPLRDRVVPAVSSGAIPPLSPAVWQRGVTGPEMEGWIDLAMDTESMEF